MAQFDYYRMPSEDGYWLDCQTEVMEHYETRFVIPLVPVLLGPQPRAARLNPLFDIAGTSHSLLAQFAGSIPRTELGHVDGSLEHERYSIMNALDFLLSGF